MLQAIIEAPGDISLRLICADWLEENGAGAQGEFIRVQVQLATLNDVDRTCPYLDDYGRSEPRWKEGKCVCVGCKLVRREQELLRKVHEWFPLLAGLKTSPAYERGTCTPHFYPGSGGTWYPFEFRRGFVTSVTCPYADFNTHASAIRAVTPLEEVHCTTWPDLDTTWYQSVVFRGRSCRSDSLRGKAHIVSSFLDDGRTYSEIIEQLLNVEWSGLEFFMPTSPPPNTDTFRGLVRIGAYELESTEYESTEQFVQTVRDPATEELLRAIINHQQQILTVLDQQLIP